MVEMLTHYFCSGHRKWNTLAFRGRLMSLLELCSAGSHRGRSSHWSLAYSICWIRVMYQCEALRSEEHTSELQSRFDLVCRLLLEKKNNTDTAYSLDLVHMM